MEATDVVKILADPRRLRVLAAISLGAATTEVLAEQSGVDVRSVGTAMSALEGAGLVTRGPGGLEVDYNRLRELATPAKPALTDAAGRPRPDLEPFVQGGRLRTLPSRQGRRYDVLSHIAEMSFAADAVYDEAAVNDVLQRWCEKSDVDHVAIRRYLVDHKLLFRVGGVYGRDPRVLPEPGDAERYMEAVGLS